MKRFTELIHDISGAVMVIGQTLIAAFGVIAILFFIVYVEIQRVAHGIELFEAEKGASLVGAAVLVLLLLTLEFITHYVETKHGYEVERDSAYSLRLAWRWFRYFIGWSNDWTARQLSPAQSIKSYSRLLTLTILALALGGSMSEAISSVQGTWTQGLQAIAIESSLSEMVEWLAGVLFAFALVIGSQRVTAYMAQRAAETLEESNEPKHDVPTIEVVQQISTEMQKLESKLAPLSTNVPIIAEWVIKAENMHILVCEDCGWETEPKETSDAATRALRAHQARYCPTLQDIPESAKVGQNGYVN